MQFYLCTNQALVC